MVLPKEQFTGSLEQTEKYNIRYNDNMYPMSSAKWHLYSGPNIIPLKIGDYIFPYHGLYMVISEEEWNYQD